TFFSSAERRSARSRFSIHLPHKATLSTTSSRHEAIRSQGRRGLCRRRPLVFHGASPTPAITPRPKVCAMIPIVSRRASALLALALLLLAATGCSRYYWAKGGST